MCMKLRPGLAKPDMKWGDPSWTSAIPRFLSLICNVRVHEHGDRLTLTPPAIMARLVSRQSPKRQRSIHWRMIRYLEKGMGDRGGRRDLRNPHAHRTSSCDEDGCRLLS